MIMAELSDDVQPANPQTVEEKRERARDLLGQATLRAYAACGQALDGATSVGDEGVQGAVRKNMAVAQQRLSTQSEKIDDVVNGRLAFAKWNDVTDAALSEAVTAWEAIEDANSIAGRLSAKFKSIFGDDEPAPEPSTWAKIWAGILAGLKAALNFLREVAKAVGDILKEILGAVGSAVGSVLTSVLLPVGGLAIALIFVLPKLLDAVGRNAKSTGEGIRAAKGLSGYGKRRRRLRAR